LAEEYYCNCVIKTNLVVIYVQRGYSRVKEKYKNKRKYVWNTCYI